MDVLASRKTGGLITGDIRVNGFPKEAASFSRISGYVEQTDVHLPHSSVREALEFSALLRLPTTVSSTRRASFVDEILELVELKRLQDAFVGVPGVSGLSVEQRKRLTLAVELVANPSIVFMDEPTSGLDARAAAIVVAAIRSVVDTGRTVVVTLHQPSVDIFEAFDELLLLKPGGETIYNGPLGDGGELLVKYLQSLPGIRRIEPHANPANWMLEVTSHASERAGGVDFAEAYASSDVSGEVDKVIGELESPADDSRPLAVGELHVASVWLQFQANFHRFWRQYWRSPEYNLTRLAVTIGIAFVFGSLFWRKGQQADQASGVLNIAGVLFSSVLFLGITDCLTIQQVTAVQRAVMYRERAAGMYGVLPFSLAQQAVELPYLIVQTILYSSIVYWMVYFAVDAAKFFLFCLFFLLTLIYFVNFGVAAVCLTPNVALSNVLCSFFFGLWNLTCGFLIPRPSMPAYWRWFYYINPVSWSLYSLAVSQLGDLDDTLIVDFTGQTQTVPVFLADRFGWEYSMMWPIVGILMGFALTFSFIAVFALYRINYQRR